MKMHYFKKLSFYPDSTCTDSPNSQHSASNPVSIYVHHWIYPEVPYEYYSFIFHRFKMNYGQHSKVFLVPSIKHTVHKLVVCEKFKIYAKLNKMPLN